MVITTGRHFSRMPLGYGPSPGPRQDAAGQPLAGWDDVQVKTCTVTFRAPVDQLVALLPRPCFSIDAARVEAGLAEASVSFTSLGNLPWLAGRGYNHTGLYVHDVVCDGKTEIARGKYLSVLFENMPDPIISGREELGYPKLFATLDQEEDDVERTGRWRLAMGWGGNKFGEVVVEGLKLEVAPPEPAQPGQDVLCYKYIPRTGRPGVADVEYATVSPAPAPELFRPERTFRATDARIQFEALGFEQLPTLHHVAARLAELDIAEIVGVKMVEGKGAPDYQAQRAVATWGYGGAN
ncbi:FAD binding domain-containing protein [Colletotrichum plurivorum]|uniref:FAD binding domain-containing protein n=1 Tax=Colletotrichum plurivorum TaxID=2175906 RepID=A0A8H6NAC4_9PEZI|nr:FAD binding domain-containing protein [Colletotrichum plurivorum]